MRCGSPRGDIIGRMTTAGALDTFPLPSGVGLNDVARRPGRERLVHRGERRQDRAHHDTAECDDGSGHRCWDRVRRTSRAVVNGHCPAHVVSGRVRHVRVIRSQRTLGRCRRGAADVAATAKLSGLQPKTTYHYRLAATNPTGTAAGGDGTFTTLALPVLGPVKVDPKTWRRGSKPTQISKRSKRARVGTRISFSLDRAVPVQLKFFAKKSGRKVKGKCRRPTGRNRGAKKCTRLSLAGTISFTGHAGKNTIRFQGRISKSQEAQARSLPAQSDCHRQHQPEDALEPHRRPEDRQALKQARRVSEGVRQAARAEGGAGTRRSSNLKPSSSARRSGQCSATRSRRRSCSAERSSGRWIAISKLRGDASGS